MYIGISLALVGISGYLEPMNMLGSKKSWRCNCAFLETKFEHEKDRYYVKEGNRIHRVKTETHELNPPKTWNLILNNRNLISWIMLSGRPIRIFVGKNSTWKRKHIIWRSRTTPYPAEMGDQWSIRLSWKLHCAEIYHPATKTMRSSSLSARRKTRLLALPSIW
jgi:hypothetical protein